MPDPVLTAVDPESGESFAVTESDYRANPGAYTLAEGQTLAYDPTGGVAPVTAGLEVTAETLAGPEIGARISAQELAAQERERTAEKLTGGFTGAAGAAARGLVSGATGGLSEWVFTPEDELGRELEQMRLDTVGKYQAGAELIGEIGLTLLSGGTAGAAGAVARRTAPGLVARAGARIAGTGAERTLARQVAAGAFEQAALDVTKAVAAQAISDEPLSISALSETLPTSLLLGGGAAGLLGIAGRGVGRLGQRAPVTPADALAAAATDPVALRRALKEAESGALVGAADALGAGVRRKSVKLSSLFSGRAKSPTATRRAARELVDQVEARGARASRAREALADLEAAHLASGQPLHDSLLARVRMAADDHEIAARAAAEHLPAVARDAEAAVAGQAVAMDATAVPAFRALDRADRDLSQALAEVRKALPPLPAATAPEAQGLFSRAADALGVLEVAQTAGAAVPSIRSIPGVGPLLSTLAQVRTIARAASGLGLLPGAQIADAAQAAAQAADKFRGFLGAMSRRPIVRSGALPRALRVASAGALRTLIADVQASDNATLDQATAARWSELPDELRSQLTAASARRLDYLRQIAPKPPPGLETVPHRWSPTPSQLRQFGEVAGALEQPLAAVQALFAGGWHYPLEVAAGLRAVYPDIYSETQQHLITNAAQIARRNPRPLVASWNRMFEVRSLPELQPSYSLPPSQPAPSTAASMPPASSRSPAAESAEARPHLRRG